MPRRVIFLLYAITLCVLSARTASAQNPFIIDGVVPANGSPGGVDPVQTNDPFGSAQELGALNASTTKVGVINSDAPPTLDFTNPNGQVDLRRIWTQTAKAVNGHIWFYFGWERDANSGSGFISFEFQQGALSPTCVYTGATIDMIKPETAAETQLKNTCNPWANRQAGDFLILWDQSGNALNITKRVFNGVAFGPSVALGTVYPAISADGFKGEAAIDMTVDVFPAQGCVSFANIIPGTVTGNSDTADYKDTVLSAFEPVSNCGSVKIIKATVPTGQTGTFPYTLARQDASALRFDGTKQLANTLTFDGDFDTYLNLKEGSNYTLTEGAQTSPWERTSIICASGSNGTSTDITNGGTFEIVATKLTTCTITNSRRRGAIQVIKHVVNNNGGTAAASDFTITLQDTNPTTTPFPGHESPGDTFTFDEGHAFNVSELAVTGYTPSLSGDCAGTIVAGVTKTCTITNDDQTAHLKLVKTVTNDNGGTAVATDFTLSAAGPTPISGAGGKDSDVNAGIYTLSETNLPGYIAGSWSCTGGTFTAPNTIQLALGQTATCTINNNDQTAHLKLVKTVTNDNGGTAAPTAFTLSAAGLTPISGAGGAESDVKAGTYTLSETNVAGYTAGNWSCTGGTFTAPDKIAIAPGQSATCTINNNDQTAHLKLVKTVTNDDGGTAVATDFTLSAAGPSPLSGAGVVESDVNTGTYTLSETTLPGYTTGSWSCTGGTFTAPDKIALALGQTATCTINNNDQTAHLKLVKTVTNDNGGTALPTAFTLSADGPTPISGAGGKESDVNAGTYTLSETTLPGYTASAWSCSGGTFTAPDKIAVALGQSATCTVNNNDQTAHLKLVKTVTNNNGGTALPTAFTLSAAGPTPISGAGGAESDVNTGTYTLSETTLPGYLPGSWACVGGTQNGASVTLALGQSATCTINNDDVAQTNGSATAQSTVLHDGASITNIRPISGKTYKVTFRLYKNVEESSPTCNAATRIFTATRDLTLTATADPTLKNATASTTGAASADTTDDGTNIVTASGTYYWTVQLASDVNNVGVAEECGREMTILTIDNNHTN